jgi:hypothetical protein
VSANGPGSDGTPAEANEVAAQAADGGNTTAAPGEE